MWEESQEGGAGHRRGRWTTARTKSPTDQSQQQRPWVQGHSLYKAPGAQKRNVSAFTTWTGTQQERAEASGFGTHAPRISRLLPRHPYATLRFQMVQSAAGPGGGGGKGPLSGEAGVPPDPLPETTAPVFPPERRLVSPGSSHTEGGSGPALAGRPDAGSALPTWALRLLFMESKASSMERALDIVQGVSNPEKGRPLAKITWEVWNGRNGVRTSSRATWSGDIFTNPSLAREVMWPGTALTLFAWKFQMR